MPIWQARDVAVQRRGRLEHRQQPGGERVAVGGQLLDAAAPDADGGELRRHVHGVDQDQRRDDEDGHEDHEWPV